MKIQWLGHSCFKLTESTGTSIVCDPFEDVGYRMPKVAAQLVTVSHDHSDHNYVKGVDGNPTVLKEDGFYNHHEDVDIIGIPSDHDKEGGSRRGKNIIFKFRMDGLDICHMGDIGELCNPRLVESLLPVNVLMIPVGGKYTIDAEEAKEYVDALMPDIVIPIHYKTKSHRFDIDRLDPFLKMFDDSQITVSENSYVELDREDLDGDETQVLVLQRMKE